MEDAAKVEDQELPVVRLLILDQDRYTAMWKRLFEESTPELKGMTRHVVLTSPLWLITTARHLHT
jgi:hypothetical protein